MSTNIPEVYISVIIPAFNDSRELERCLKALENQSVSRDLFQVIVVDNASQENLKDVVDQFSQVIYTYEAKPGSYAARNKGIALAKGNIIAFTDSDCVPEPTWLEKAAMMLSSKEYCGLLAGKIEIFFKDACNPTPVELYDYVIAFPQQQYLQDLHFGATANIFTYKSVFDAVGTFDESLKSSGDYEWGRRVFAAGYNQIYADDVCVHHPARYSLNDIYKKTRRVMDGKFVLYGESRNPIRRYASSLLGEMKQVQCQIQKTIAKDKLSLISKLKVLYVIVFIALVRSTAITSNEFRILKTQLMSKLNTQETQA